MSETQAYFSEGVWSEYVRPDGRPTALKREGNVVRCQDCRYHVSVTDGDVCRKPCGDEAAGRVWVEPDGFCAWGKPRSK